METKYADLIIENTKLSAKVEEYRDVLTCIRDTMNMVRTDKLEDKFKQMINEVLAEKDWEG
jgi:hypothetical protein